MQTDVTQMLLRWSAGDQEALHRLLPLLYDQLKQLARDRRRRDGAGSTLNTTGLVHECYLRLVDITRVEWRDRAHFLAMASRTMRRILIDYARRQKANKRGGGEHDEEFSDDLFIPPDHAETLLELDDALQQLEAAHPRRGKALELRYFGGLTLEEAAGVLGVSPATVMRDVRFGEAWLAREWKDVGRREGTHVRQDVRGRSSDVRELS